jgi:hypothetical protein
MAYTNDALPPSRRLDGREDIERWLAERKAALDRLMASDELARCARAQATRKAASEAEQERALAARQQLDLFEEAV